MDVWTKFAYTQGRDRGDGMKLLHFIGLLFIVFFVIAQPLEASRFKSMVRFFAVEFESAKILRNELQNLPYKKNSNEEHLLNLLETYVDEIGKLGGLMRDHHEGKPVPPQKIIQSLKSISNNEFPLMTEIQKTLFENFNSTFLERRSEEFRQSKKSPERINPVWDRALHKREIDFYKWFKGEIQWNTPQDSIHERNTQFFNWLEENLEEVGSLIEHDSETAFDWAYASPSFTAESEDPLPSPPSEPEPEFDRDLALSPIRLAEPLIQVPRKQKKTQPSKSAWQQLWSDIHSTTFQEFRRNLGPTLMR